MNNYYRIVNDDNGEFFVIPSTMIGPWAEYVDNEDEDKDLPEWAAPVEQMTKVKFKEWTEEWD